MFHKSNFGKFGDSLPCDLDGYVPTANDEDWHAFCWEAGTEWDAETWHEFRRKAVKATAEAELELAAWRRGEES